MCMCKGSTVSVCSCVCVCISNDVFVFAFEALKVDSAHLLNVVTGKSLHIDAIQVPSSHFCGSSLG